MSRDILELEGRTNSLHHALTCTGAESVFVFLYLLCLERGKHQSHTFIGFRDEGVAAPRLSNIRTQKPINSAGTSVPGCNFCRAEVLGGRPLPLTKNTHTTKTFNTLKHVFQLARIIAIPAHNFHHIPLHKHILNGRKRQNAATVGNKMTAMTSPRHTTSHCQPIKKN